MSYAETGKEANFLLDESRKRDEKDKARTTVAETVKAVAAELQDKFGVEVEVVESLDGVQNEKARKALAAGKAVKGWYEPSTGKVYIYAPNAESEQDVMTTYAHEVVAHKGMRGLLGEERYNKLCRRLGAALTPEQRGLVEEYEGGDAKVLGDEYVARIAEMLIDEKGEIKEPTTWEKVKGAVREFFHDVLGLELTDADIRYMLWRSGERLRRNKVDVLTRAQDVVTGQKLNDDAARYRTTRELDRQHPGWRDQTTPTGRHSTQRANTVNTYRKIGEWIKREMGDGATVLDASSGLGLGTQELRSQGLAVDDVEPYPDSSREAPTFAGYDEIYKQYDVVVSNAVLNVVPDDTRSELLHQMADMVKPGGRIMINVRDAGEIERQKQKIELDSPNEVLVTDRRGNVRSYQKGFTPGELRQWVADDLGEEWTIEKADKDNSGLTGATAVVAVRKEGMNPSMAESEQDEALSRVNDAFNTQLRSFAPETADKTIFKLGRPSDILIAAGVVDKEMKLYGSKLLKKMREHGFALSEIKDLPLSIASPIAVFDNHRSGSNRAILTELRTVDGNILVTIEVGKGGDVDFNIVSSVFGKRGNSVVNWINKGYATYIDKEKALSYLHLSAPIAEATESQELALAAKVIQKFENPKTERENPPKDAHFNSSKQGDLFQRAQYVVTDERLQDESARMRQEEADYQREAREITERAKADGTFMKAPNGTYDKGNDDIRFAIGRKRKDDMRKGLLNKLTNATEEQVERTITEIEKLGERSKAGGDAKVEKAALHWARKGTIILPEDGEKVLQAVKMADRFKVNVIKYDRPQQLIDEYLPKVQENDLTRDEREKILNAAEEKRAEVLAEAKRLENIAAEEEHKNSTASEERDEHGNNKKNIWSASSEQNVDPAAGSGGLRTNDKTESAFVPKGTPSNNPSSAKVTQEFENPETNKQNSDDSVRFRDGSGAQQTSQRKNLTKPIPMP